MLTEVNGKLLNNSQMATRMKSLFESSLELHLSGQYMEVSLAIVTPLLLSVFLNPGNSFKPQITKEQARRLHLPRFVTLYLSFSGIYESSTTGYFSLYSQGSCFAC